MAVVEPYSLDVEIEYAYDYDPGCRGSWEQPPEGPQASVETMHVWYVPNGKDKPRIKLTLPPEVLRDIARDLEAQIEETEADNRWDAEADRRVDEYRDRRLDD